MGSTAAWVGCRGFAASGSAPVNRTTTVATAFVLRMASRSAPAMPTASKIQAPAFPAVAHAGRRPTVRPSRRSARPPACPVTPSTRVRQSAIVPTGQMSCAAIRVTTVPRSAHVPQGPASSADRMLTAPAPQLAGIVRVGVHRRAAVARTVTVRAPCAANRAAINAEPMVTVPSTPTITVTGANMTVGCAARPAIVRAANAHPRPPTRARARPMFASWPLASAPCTVKTAVWPLPTRVQSPPTPAQCLWPIVASRRPGRPTLACPIHREDPVQSACAQSRRLHARGTRIAAQVNTVGLPLHVQ